MVLTKEFTFRILYWLFVTCQTCSANFWADNTAIFLAEGEENKTKEAFVANYNNSEDPPMQLDQFEKCDPTECFKICGTNDTKRSFCDKKNNKLCMCATDNFMSSNVVGTVLPVNREDDLDKNCSFACNLRNSYARIWRRTDSTGMLKSCTCLMNQMTSTGITLCDEFALKDVCKSVCQHESAVCTYNGVCLCRQTWPSVFTSYLRHTREEYPPDKKECSSRCKDYHTEYVGRIYDSLMGLTGGSYKFREKFCMCGVEIQPEDAEMRAKLHGQGFQECTDLKCKVRCGRNMKAKCEPELRRACLCPKANIFIGKFLWARLPAKTETMCVEACWTAGLKARVIEWNPLFQPEYELYSGSYRRSTYSYLYDGRFCHCINLDNELNVNQFRPCTDEMCQWLCGHNGGVCDPKTRRVCLCNTHQMLGALGRRPDPAEYNCNMICRRNLADARILEVHWQVAPPEWSVIRAKFCGCVRPVSPSGLTHCEGPPGRDICPQLCSNPEAYCTDKKVCHCSTKPNLLDNQMIRLPSGKEAEECGEACRSWTWPMAEDLDNLPHIYDESRGECSVKESCESVDTTPWSLSEPGALKAHIDALEESPNAPKKYCLCAKTMRSEHIPGVRFGMELEPPRLPSSLRCISNYTCIAVGNNVHVIA